MPRKCTRAKDTIWLSDETLDRLRRAVYWTPGLTKSKVYEDAVVRHLDELERENGGPFPPITGELKRGRPLKTT